MVQILRSNRNDFQRGSSNGILSAINNGICWVSAIICDADCRIFVSEARAAGSINLVFF